MKNMLNCHILISNANYQRALVSWLKQSEEMRKIMQDEMAVDHAREENGALYLSTLRACEKIGSLSGETKFGEMKEIIL